MNNLSKILAPLLNAVGLIGLVVGLFATIILAGGGARSDAWPWACLLGASLALLFLGNKLGKAAEPSAPAAEGRGPPSISSHGRRSWAFGSSETSCWS